MASIFEINDQTGKCHLCPRPVESDGVYHDGAQEDCLAHKLCVERELRISNKCAKCETVLNRSLILFGKEDGGKEASLKERKVVDLSGDEAPARKLQEEGNQGVECPGDAELAQRLQEEENQQVQEIVDPDLALARQLQEEESQQVQEGPLQQEQALVHQRYEIFHFDDLGAAEPPVQQVAQPALANRACNVVAAVVVAASVAALSYLNAS